MSARLHYDAERIGSLRNRGGVLKLGGAYLADIGGRVRKISEEVMALALQSQKGLGTVCRKREEGRVRVLVTSKKTTWDWVKVHDQRECLSSLPQAFEIQMERTDT